MRRLISSSDKFRTRQDWCRRHIFHRFGPAFNTHFHFHVVVLDGVFSSTADGEGGFHEASALFSFEEAAQRLQARPPTSNHFDDEDTSVLAGITNGSPSSTALAFNLEISSFSKFSKARSCSAKSAAISAATSRMP